MAILTFRDVTFGFGSPPLLDGCDLSIELGERVALVGRNGAGKSTLLKLITGEFPPDAGSVSIESTCCIAAVPQDVSADLTGTVYDVVAHGLEDLGDLIAEYHDISHRLTTSGSDDRLVRELDRVHHAIDARGGWHLAQCVESVLSRMELDADAVVEELSAGLRRRVLVARALVRSPDLLLLDEPTNHLDVEAIRWLEDFLLGFNGSLLFVSHDREFLRRVATRIVDLDRGRLASFACSWEKYLERKDAELEAEATQRAEFEKKLAQEEVWIRRGVKERRKRNQGRVRRLLEMREEQRHRRDFEGRARVNVQDARRTGRVVIRATDVSFGFDAGGDGADELIRSFSIEIQRGDRVGILGPNGAGKTTLIRLLLGELEPRSGAIRHGTHLEPVFFDQLHAGLDPDKTAREIVADGHDFIVSEGGKQHVVGYLRDFLFTAERVELPTSRLSGGERNRLELARIFARPSNLLVLDEPTNDLDTETLELLEQVLSEYAGTVLVVSHDRAFLDNVVTSTLAFEGRGRVREYVGGYTDQERQRAAVAEVSVSRAERDRRSPAAVERPKPRGLTWNEQKELEGLPERLERLEADRDRLHAQMADPSFYERDRAEVDQTTSQLREIDAELTSAYERWEELETVREQGRSE